MLSVAFLVKHPPLDRFSMLCEYLRIVATEVVVVSTGLTDEERSAIQSWSDRFEHGLKIVDYEWHDDFAAARNAGLVECTQPWTLVLDPDEMPSVGMILHIMKVLSGEVARENAKGWLYWTVNYWGGVKGPEENYHWHCRLFRTGSGRFYRPVHELVSLDGVPEENSRGTAMLPTAPPLAYLIHSKSADELEVADALYERIGQVSR